MPPTEEMIDEAIRCLTGTTFTSFTATPATVRPFGTGSTLKWQARPPTGCAVRFLLNGVAVPATGSRTVQPSVTTSFRLEASQTTVRRHLGTRTVSVDTSACFSGSVPEADIRSQVQAAVTRLDAATARISQRSTPSVEVDAAGIKIRLRFKIAIDDFADPDLDVDMTVGLRVQGGQVSPFYRDFSVDVDWPWWVTVVTLGVSKIVEEVVENEIEGKLKTAILGEIKKTFDSFLALIPATHRLYSLASAPDRVDFTVCQVPTTPLPKDIAEAIFLPVKSVTV